MEVIAIFANVCVYLLAVVNCQDIRLCRSAGPLHLPPAGCALKKNFVAEQNCYIISVVCKEGQIGTGVRGAASTSSTLVPVIITAASIDASAQQQNIYKPESFCPLYNESAPAECEGRRECNANRDCGIVQLCCRDIPCKKKLCKDKLLPCPPEDTKFPENCTLTNVVDTKGNCVKTIAKCAGNILNGTNESTTAWPTGIAPAAAGETVSTSSSPTPPANAALVTETTSRTVTGAATIGTTAPKTVIGACPPRGTNASNPANCDRSQKKCNNDTDCSASELCCVDDNCATTVCKNANGLFQVVAPKLESGGKAAGSSSPNLRAGNVVAVGPSLTGANAMTATTVNASNLGAAIQNEAVKGNRSRPVCPPRDPAVQPSPSSCDRNQKQCNDDAECPAGKLCCADDDCEATVCKASVSSATIKPDKNAAASVGNGSAASAEAATQQQNVPKSSAGETNANGTVETAPGLLPYQVGGEVAPVPVNLSSSTMTKSDNNSAISAGNGPASAPSQPQTSSNATRRFCPVRNATALPNPANCDKRQRVCQDDSECAEPELCCADDDCEGTFCKASFIACPPDENGGAIAATRGCPGQLVMDKARNCVKAAVVCS